MTTSKDEPLDVAAVAGDDELVERLRAKLDDRHSLSPDAAVVWGDDDDDSSDDPGYALLRALQLDVSGALPTAVPAAGAVVPLAPRRRAAGRTATIAAVTAGVLSLAGVAAAATASPGDAMYGVRSAVSSAVHDVVQAITPETSDTTQAAPAATPTATISPRGEAVAAAARSASAVVQIEERLATATRLLDNKRPRAATEVLAQAERRLPLVADVARRASLQARVDALQVRAAQAAAGAPDRKPTDRPNDHGKSTSEGKKATPRPTRTPGGSEHRSPGESNDKPAPGETRRVVPDLPSVSDRGQLRR